MERLSSGNAAFNKLLGGGYPRSNAVLVLGPTGSGKTTLSHEFLINALKTKMNVLFISTNTPYENCAQQIRDEHIKIDPNKFVFIDCYSWRQPGEPEKQPENVVLMQSISNMNELLRTTNMAMKKMGRIDAIILDSVSDLILYSEPAAVFKSIQMLHGMLTKENAVGLFIIEEGLHDDKTVNTINYICDGEIKMHTDGDKRELNIARMTGTEHILNWIRYEIVDGPKINIKGE